MEVRPGYKQTDVGVIPVGWEVLPIGELVSDLRGGAALKPSDFSRVGVKVLPKGGVGRTGWLTIHDEDIQFCTRIYADAHRQNQVDQNYTIVVLRDLVPSGPSIGLIVQIRYPETFVLAQGVYGFKTDRKADSRYLVQVSHTNWYRRLMNQIMVGSTQVHITNTAFKNARLPVPALYEQQAIANALCDVDELLAGLDRLIAKKRDIKHAAMQQLLTGQTRLPGFQGEWKDVAFADLVRHHSGNSALIKGKLSSANAAGLFPAYSASGQDVWYSRFEHEGEAIIVSAVGSRCGKAFHASGKWSAIANTHVVWPNPARVELRFLTRFLDDEDFWQKSGTGQPFVLFKKTFSQRLMLPAREEQLAIATVLSDMDAEVTALEARRDKTRALKQGMMQELLTGRTRLV